MRVRTREAAGLRWSDLDADTVTIVRRHKIERTETYLWLGVTASAGDRVFATG